MPGGGRRDGAGDRRPRPRREAERSTSIGADGRRHRSQLGKKPTQLSADAGYCSDANLTAMEEREIDAYSRRGGPSTPGKEKAAAAASPPCAKNEGRRALRPLPLKKAAARAGVRTDQAGARLPSVSLARRREGRQRVRLVCLAHGISKLAQGRTQCLAALRNRLSFTTLETVQRTMAAKLRPNLTSNRMCPRSCRV